ncbi:transporter [Kutzneria viridogrisea]|uniref:AMMECR1 domain-containing protein n=2 Tax=Kutzneria TaxID=43356 RepID=A0ABR6BP40_9PSEU|nr:hypothetical protein [Kutzneria albida]AHH96121.1 putative membrane protein [Kutzneria albida DSM 43870]MBA8928673.1 hypothetical protein [Kutzneria viridogrisea]
MIRALLVLAVFVFFALCVFGMWWGYRNRARHQAAVLPSFPPVPADLGEELLPAATGVYVSTVTDASWQDRVAVGDLGFRSEATLRLYPQGLLFDRVGAEPVWVPVDAVREANVGQGLAGKVMFSGDGLLIVRWELDGTVLDSGFRGDDKDVYEQWVAALRQLAGNPGVGGGAR